MGANVLEITDDNFDSEVLKSDQPVLVDFWATWCVPCIKELPLIEKLQQERKDVKVSLISMDMDLDPDPEKVYRFVDRKKIQSEVLILNEPTRGMDVGAKREVLDLIKALRAEGVAIVLISTEPETILAESDRILVMAKGQIAREFVGEQVSKDLLMSYA